MFRKGSVRRYIDSHFETGTINYGAIDSVLHKIEVKHNLPTGENLKTRADNLAFIDEFYATLPYVINYITSDRRHATYCKRLVLFYEFAMHYKEWRESLRLLLETIRKYVTSKIVKNREFLAFGLKMFPVPREFYEFLLHEIPGKFTGMLAKINLFHGDTPVKWVAGKLINSDGNIVKSKVHAQSKGKFCIPVIYICLLFPNFKKISVSSISTLMKYRIISYDVSYVYLSHRKKISSVHHNILMTFC